MDMKLETVKYIEKHGLNNLLEEFKLKSNIHADKVIIKYNQIESDMSQDIVQECRGLILEKDTWKVISYPFKKFFNAQEGHAPEIDWGSAYVLEKVDGSFIHLYWDWNRGEWVCATTGTAEGEGTVNNRIDFTFKELFWETVENKYPNFTIDNLNMDEVYMFELTSPYNTVVKEHKEPGLTLLGIRNRETLVELCYDEVKAESDRVGVPIVKRFDMNPTTISDLTDTFDGMPYSEEGYVIIDKNMNRVKVKNPAYVAVHHLKDKFNSYNIMEIIKTNEVEEFNATFPERKEEVLELKDKYDRLMKLLLVTWGALRTHLPKEDSHTEKKRFAEMVFKTTMSNEKLKGFSGLFFSLENGRIETIGKYLKGLNNKKLYKELKDKKWNIKE